MRKRDSRHPEFFTNKLSMVRICRDVSENGSHQWCDNIRCACNFDRPNHIFKGLGIARASFFKSHGFGFEPAASTGNPYHMHLIIEDYNEPYREVSSISELLGEDLREKLEELRHNVHYVYCDKNSMPECATPCELCNLHNIPE